MYTASNWRHSTNGFLPKPVLQVEKKKYCRNSKLLPSLCSDYREEINDRKRCEIALVFVSMVYRIFFDIISSESNIKYIDFCGSEL